MPLDPGTVAALRRHAAQTARERLLAGPGWNDTGHVFTEPNGDLLNPNKVTKLCKRLVAEHQLPPVRTHSMRHTAASLVAASGGTIQDAQVLMGHENYTMTAAVYAHLFPEAMRDTANATAALIPRSKINGGEVSDPCGRTTSVLYLHVVDAVEHGSVRLYRLAYTGTCTASCSSSG